MSILLPLLARRAGSGVPGKSWSETFLAASGTTIFAFEFDQNLLDSSGNGFNASISGMPIIYNKDDPSPVGGYSAQVYGSTYASLPLAACVTGTGTPFTILGIAKVPTNGFGNNILWMGGGNNGGAVSISFWGSGTAPQVACDFNYSWINYAVPVNRVDNWMTVIVDYNGTTIRIYTAIAGETDYTLAGSSNMSIGHTVDRNALFEWNGIRRFIGKCAFVGLKQGVMTDAEKALFLVK